MTTLSQEGTEKSMLPIPKYSASKSQCIPGKLTRRQPSCLQIAALLGTAHRNTGERTRCSSTPRQDMVNTTKRDLPRPIRGNWSNAALRPKAINDIWLTDKLSSKQTRSA